MVVKNHEIWLLIVNKLDRVTSILSKQIFIPKGHGKLWSETGILIKGIYTIGKTWQLEGDKSCNDNKRLHETRKATS